MRARLIAVVIGVVGGVGRIGGRPVGRLAGGVILAGAALVPRLASSWVRLLDSLVLLFATSDARPVAVAAADTAGRSRRPAVASAAHALLLRLGDHAAAGRVSARLGDRVDPATRRRLATAEAAASGDAMAALAHLGDPDHDDRPARQSRLGLLRSLGRAQEVVSLTADATDPTVAGYRFDALWDLGRVEEAVETIDAVVGPDLRSIDLLRRVRDAHLHVDGAESPILGRVLDDAAQVGGDWLAVVLFELDRVDDLVERGRAETFVSTLGPGGRLQLARARYVARDFDGARTLLEPLRASGRRWDAEKLLARIELEGGISEATVRARARVRRPGEGFDEVAYLGLHQLGHHAEAFAGYLPDADRRILQAVFGARADLNGTASTATRLVLPQGGPGDEILMAATYADLATRADETHASCDPRLASLLERSLPQITFHPCARRASRSAPGFLGEDRPERADNVLYEHLDRVLDLVATSCDRVVFGRSLGSLLVAEAPVDAFLAPDRALVERMRPRIAGAIGVVWRSEFDDAVRSIHYLRPQNLAPLRALGRPIVCLQHDVRPGERQTLAEVFGPDIVHLDDVDLRDDFETMAAVAAGLDAVVGIGTTMIELAAAVGAPTVTMYPNRIGAWRRRGRDGDFWHRSMRTAVAPDPRQREGAVDDAVNVLRDLVGAQPPGR